MSENTEIRSALELLAAEPLTEQIDYYRKPFMVLWAAIQEAASDVAEDYDLPADMAQLWVAEQMRQVADSLVDRLAEKAVAHGASKSNVARAAGASPANAARRFPRLGDDAASQTRLLIAQAYSGFNTAHDPDLIESYVFEINALQARYSYLLRRVKELDEG